ncbi:MAG: HDIG domain-containing protein [Syntrophales bacterium LBB04]|nr:HDIG domain-containing protein [Syntrophales bacterium LBB04]
MLPQIQGHSLQVCRVALCLGENLIPHFPKLDMALIEAGALLHDIAKTECLKTKGNHVEIGAEMIRTLGFNSVARIVAQHVHFEKVFPQNGSIDEVVLVHYADKRVLHEEVVSLKERFTYLTKTYGHSEDVVMRIEALYQDTLKLEKMIFLHLSFPPQALKEHLSRSNSQLDWMQ